VTGPDAYAYARFRLDPSKQFGEKCTNVTDRTVRQIRQTGQTDRQTDTTDRQRSDSIGRTVLQTVAQKRCSTFVIITLENLFDLLYILHCCKHKEHFYTYMETCSLRVSNVLTQLCENEASHVILL